MSSSDSTRPVKGFVKQETFVISRGHSAFMDDIHDNVYISCLCCHILSTRNMDKVNVSCEDETSSYLFTDPVRRSFILATDIALTRCVAYCIFSKHGCSGIRALDFWDNCGIWAGCGFIHVNNNNLNGTQNSITIKTLAPTTASDQPTTVSANGCCTSHNGYI
eukprot:scaffold32060_cov56-Attheya_sp.AAC.1